MLQVHKEIFRGPRPKDLHELRMYGVDTIISLQSGWYQLLNEDKYERQFPSDYGIRHYDLGSSDIWPPESWVVNKCLDLMTQERHIYIHCKSGVDRTGFICAVYRMQVQNWTFNEAFQEWIAEGRHPWFFWWKRELKKYSHQLYVPPGDYQLSL